MSSYQLLWQRVRQNFGHPPANLTPRFFLKSWQPWLALCSRCCFHIVVAVWPHTHSLVAQFQEKTTSHTYSFLCSRHSLNAFSDRNLTTAPLCIETHYFQCLVPHHGGFALRWAKRCEQVFNQVGIPGTPVTGRCGHRAASWAWIPRTALRTWRSHGPTASSFLLLLFFFLTELLVLSS